MKRLWSLLLVLLLIPCLVMAASAATSGTCGKNLTWAYEKATGTLTISGTGDMYGYYREASDPDEDWYYSNAPWIDESVKTVIVEEGVTSIGSGAFLEIGSLTEITLPSTLTYIGSHAFDYCYSLQEIVFPDSLTTIADRAFISCYGLNRIRLPGNDRFQIGEYAFDYACASVIEIPAGLTTFRHEDFLGASVAEYIVSDENPAYCAVDGVLFNKDQSTLISCPKRYAFTNGAYRIPDSVKTVGKNAFQECTVLSSLTVPESVEVMEEGAFDGCYDVKVRISDLAHWMQTGFADETANPLTEGGSLYLNGTLIEDLVIPEGTATIGDYAFTGMKCSGSVTIPASVTAVGTGAFNLGYNGTQKINITDLSAWMKIRFASATSNPMVRGGDLYVNGKVLTELTVPAGITAVGDYAFSDCDTLTRVVIPDRVTSIGKNAFWDCDALADISVPDSVTLIDDGAFERCSVLTDIHIPKNLKTVNAYVFSECSALTSVTLPETVTAIGDCAFYQCSTLASVNIPKAVTYIGYEAFRQCRQLTSVTVPDAVTEIGADAFAYCSGLKELNLGTGLKKLGAGAFLECKRIKELNIPGAIGTVPKGVAKYCVSLEKVTIGEGVTLIDYEAFAGCTKLKSISFPSTLKQLFREAFEDCDSLTEFYLQTIDTWIDLESLGVYQGEYVDYEDTCYSNKHLLGGNSEPKNLYVKGKKVTDVVIPAGKSYLVEYMFYSTTIESVVIPGSVAIVPEYAFSNCTSLERVVIGPEHEDINEYAFKGCKNLKTITLPDSMYYIGENAFAGCEDLSKVYYGGSKTKRGKINIEDGNGRLENASWEYNCNLELSAPVVKITGVASSGKPKVTWSAVEGAERYRVYRATSKSGSYTYLGYTTGLSYTDKTAKAGTNYFYKVTAFDNDTQSASLYSNIVNRCCDLKRPVVTLKVDTASGKPKVTFEKISGAEKYYIVRATSEKGTYTKLATTTSTSYIDKTAKAGKTYYYKVKALHAKDSADSAYSAVTSRVCDLKKPVVTITLKSGDPRIKWDAISGAEKYMVYRATSKDGEYTHVKTTKTSTSFTDTNVKAGKTYYYKVKAIHENEAANSAYSAVKYIKAK